MPATASPAHVLPDAYPSLQPNPVECFSCHEGFPVSPPSAPPPVSAVLARSSAPAFAHVTVQPRARPPRAATRRGLQGPQRAGQRVDHQARGEPPDRPPAGLRHAAAAPRLDAKVTKSKLDKPLETHGKKIDEAVTKVTWTAAAKDRAGLFQQFPRLRRPAARGHRRARLQGPADVRRQGGRALDRGAAGGPAEPENPAPALPLTAASADGHAHGAAAASAAARRRHSPATPPAPPRRDGSDTTARVLGIAGIVVGVAGVASASSPDAAAPPPDATAPLRRAPAGRTATSSASSTPCTPGPHIRDTSMRKTAVRRGRRARRGRAHPLRLRRLRRRAGKPSPSSSAATAQKAAHAPRPALRQAGPRPHRHPRQDVRPGQGDGGPARRCSSSATPTAPTSARRP